MNTEDFNVWKENIYKSIKDISNLEMQRQSWSGKSPNIVSSFPEIVNTLYDYEFEEFIDYLSNNDYNKDLVSKLIEFNIVINNYDEHDMNDIEIINDDNWINISKKAHEILNIWNVL